ncbi:MAG: DUF1501 domain-containing protein [Rhodothermaceae bacterium]|nr:DUF1501 domain-containing protein [Rhodothermaceae bacterium]
MNPCQQYTPQYTRRDFLSKTSLGLGAAALAGLIGPRDAWAMNLDEGLHFAPRAKRVIYLFQNGGPSQMELFDHKPVLKARNGEELPESVRAGQRLTGMTSGQSSFPLAGSHYSFAKYGQSGAEISELLPYTSKIADDLCIVRSMHTEAINHDPAITFFQTGSQQSGRPSIGSWISYGLGSENENLPAFTVLLSKGKGGSQPLYARLWGNGFLPSSHQGVQFRSGGEPVLFLDNPPGLNASDRRLMLDHLNELHAVQAEATGDPEIYSRIAQYEMAYRMKTSVPEVVTITDEPDYIFDLYGDEARIPGTFAANCLLARRLAEQGVKFIQLYHQGWDQHGNLPRDIARQCSDVDRASAALVLDLKQRGLLEDTLVIWGGEFGRTSYSQGQLTADNYGRDHHPRCFSIWMAGGGTKGGTTYGETDDFSYNIVKDPVHVHDFQATLLHLMGIDHERLTFKHEGRRYRLTDVHGSVVEGLLA